MSELRKILLVGASTCCAFFSWPANAAVVEGTLTVKLTGTLRVAGKGYTSVDCKARAVLIPTTGSSVTIGTATLLPWLQSGVHSSSGHAGFANSTEGSSVVGETPTSTTAGSVTGFTCKVVVPYRFSNASDSGQSIAVVFEVSASDPGAWISPGGNVPPSFVPPSYPGGSTTQVKQIALPPANPGVISITSGVKL